MNAIAEAYIELVLKEKNQTIQNTLNFIDAQLSELADTLKGVELRMQTLNKQGNIFDFSEMALKTNAKLEELEKEKASLLMKQKYYYYLQDYLLNNYDIKDLIAPTLMGVDEPQVIKFIDELYQYYKELMAFSFAGKEKNPTITVIELKIKTARKALLETLKNTIELTNNQLKENELKISNLNYVLNQLPEKERTYAKMKRKFSLNDNIYNFLLQKRIELNISKASNTTDVKVLNNAEVTGKIAPNEKSIKTKAYLYAFSIPVVIIFLITYLNTKITTKQEITKYTNLPIIGIVSHYKGQSLIPVLESPKSNFTECFRAIKANLLFLGTEKKARIYGVTSSVAGEGKTFFSINLASIFSFSGNKVVLIGADMRKPMIHKSLELDNDIGLSNILAGLSSIESAIKKTKYENLYIITSGPVPPNPMELLDGIAMKSLIEYLTNYYDIVIFDAPPHWAGS